MVHCNQIGLEHVCKLTRAPATPVVVNARSRIVPRPPAKRAATRPKGPRRLRTPSSGDLFDRSGTAKLLASNNTIFKRGEAAEFIYKILSGCVRTFSNIDKGRRRVHAFYFPGDYFGLESDELHNVSAETVTPSELLLLRQRELTAQAPGDLEVANLLLCATSSELRRIRTHNQLLLNDVVESLFAFLRDLHARSPVRNQIELPMPRNDIADYLGLTTETVSRALTRLKKASLIAMLSQRRLVLIGPAVRK
jgi:CRP/FNR family transcriptional regulator, nitrogen fixation regulation protein